MSPLERARGYLPYLDGMRALAIFTVLLFHHDNAWLPGGFLGVEVFFVISGFIITRLLLQEWEQSRGIALSAFFVRRLRRLLPGILAMLLAVGVWELFFLRDALEQFANDLPYGLTFTLNLSYILGEQSYFQTLNRPPLLEHLWSLGVEFQFYLLWPLLCLLLFPLRLRYSLPIIGVGIAVAAGWMAFLYSPGEDPSRIYFGTDTRIGAFLIGAAAALAAVRVLEAPGAPSVVARVAVINLAAFAMLVLLFFRLGVMHEDLYLGGFLMTALSAGIIIASSHLMWARGRCDPVTLLIANPLARALGLRAYSIYLWHWPVYCATQPAVDIPLEGGWLFVFRVAVTLALAELSYRVFEPVLRRTLPGPTPLVCQRPRHHFVAASLTGVVLLLGSVVPWSPDRYNPQAEPPGDHATATVGADADPESTDQEVSDSPQESAVTVAGLPDDAGEPLPAQAVDASGESSRVTRAQAAGHGQAGEPALTGDAGEAQAVSAAGGALGPAPTEMVVTVGGNGSGGGGPAAAEAAAAGEGSPTASECATAPAGSAAVRVVRRTLVYEKKDPRGYVTRAYTRGAASVQAFAVGDSVMVGAASELLRRVPGLAIDAQVGRQFATGQTLLAMRKRSGALGGLVVIHLGNNGPLGAKQIEDTLQLLAGVKGIVLINLKLPRNYESANNRLLEDVARRYPQVRVIDWRAVSATGRDIFVRDGIHLTPEGAKLYARMIALALAEQGLPTTLPSTGCGMLARASEPPAASGTEPARAPGADAPQAGGLASVVPAPAAQPRPCPPGDGCVRGIGPDFIMTAAQITP